jgi:hypothetical protein
MSLGLWFLNVLLNKHPSLKKGRSLTKRAGFSCAERKFSNVPSGREPQGNK